MFETRGIEEIRKKQDHALTVKELTNRFRIIAYVNLSSMYRILLTQALKLIPNQVKLHLFDLNNLLFDLNNHLFDLNTQFI